MLIFGRNLRRVLAVYVALNTARPLGRCGCGPRPTSPVPEPIDVGIRRRPILGGPRVRGGKLKRCHTMATSGTQQDESWALHTLDPRDWTDDKVTSAEE